MYGSSFWINKLREKGVKITPQRQIIIDAFLSSKDKHLSAEDIYAEIIKTFPGLSLDTVYRNLAIMKETGILVELKLGERRLRYEMNSNTHHHHLICTRCGLAQEIDYCPLEYLDSKLLKGFKIKDHSFKIFGLCEKCLE